MKLYSCIGCLHFLIYFSSITWAFPYQKRSSHVDRGKFDDVTLQLSDDVIKQQDVQTRHKNSGNVKEYKNRKNEVVSLAKALTQDSKEKSTGNNMVLPVLGTLTVFFSMSILVAIFQCCCRRKRQTSDSEEVKSSNDKLVDSRKNSGNVDSQEEDKKSQEAEKHERPESEEEPAVSIRSKIKAFEGVIPTQPSPGPVRPTKKRPESNAFKALESQGIVYGMGKSPSRLSKTPEDENQNATLTQEVSPTEGEITPDDDLGGYKQPENPDVVIADVDDDDEFSAIKRDTSVLRSYKKAPPPKNRNRSSAAVRRKRARETTTDLLFSDTSDGSFLCVPDDLEVVYNDRGSDNEETNSKERNKKSDSLEKDKNKKDKNDSSERNKNKKDKKDKKELNKDEPPVIVTSDFTDSNVVSKEEVPADVFSGGNIFMHIDPTVKKKNAPKIEKKPATPPMRVRSQLSVEERKEKAKSTPLLSSHEDLAAALGRLKSPSKEKITDRTAGKNRSSSDLSSNTHL